MRINLKKIIIAAVLLLIVLCASAGTAYAEDVTTLNYREMQADGRWKIKTSDTEYLHDTWFCDDVAEGAGKDAWYLLGSDGNVVTAPLLQDETGKYYLTGPGPDGMPGKILETSGQYYGMQVDLAPVRKGALASIQNSDAIYALQLQYGIYKAENISSRIYAGYFVKKPKPEKKKPAADGVNAFTLTFIDGNGEIWRQEAVPRNELPEFEEGEEPTYPEGNTEDYTFFGWQDQKGKIVKIAKATKDATYTAVFYNSNPKNTEMRNGRSMTKLPYLTKCGLLIDNFEPGEPCSITITNLSGIKVLPFSKFTYRVGDNFRFYFDLFYENIPKNKTITMDLRSLPKDMHPIYFEDIRIMKGTNTDYIGY